MLSVSPNAGLATSLLNQRTRNLGQVGQSIERLSTGKRINHAKDDPAGLIAAEGFRSVLSELNAKQKTSHYSDLLLRQRESRLSAVQSGLGELRGAAVEAAGSLASDGQKQALQQSVDATLESFDRLAGDDSPTTLDALALGGAANLVSGDTSLAQQIIDSATQSVLYDRAAVASEARFLEYERRVLEDQVVIATESLSQIEDADFAEESSRLARGQILAKSSNIALQYARQSHSELIGSLLDYLDRPGGK